MKINSFDYSIITRCGYNGNAVEQITLKVNLEDSEDYKEALQKLREETRQINISGDEVNDLVKEKNRIANKYADLKSKVSKAEATWRNVSAFLKAQGIKSDPADFPELPQIEGGKEEEAVEGELDDEF